MCVREGERKRVRERERKKEGDKKREKQGKSGWMQTELERK